MGSDIFREGLNVYVELVLAVLVDTAVVVIDGVNVLVTDGVALTDTLRLWDGVIDPELVAVDVIDAEPELDGVIEPVLVEETEGSIHVLQDK
jgi:hypothetical protein